MSSEVERIDTEPTEFSDRTWSQRVTTRLVARDRALLDDGDVVARSGQPVADRGTCGTTADDEDVGVQE